MQIKNRLFTIPRTKNNSSNIIVIVPKNRLFGDLLKLAPQGGVLYQMSIRNCPEPKLDRKKEELKRQE